MKEVRHFRVLSSSENEKSTTVQCFTCAHRCTIPEGKRGICGVMENRNGVLYSLVYGKVIALHIDPIEKKPLFHFYPGTSALSLATVGCNFRCLNCQNADISQMPRDQHHIRGEEISPEGIIDAAKKAQCPIISYTYTEPAIYFDYAYDICVLAEKVGIKNTFVTNGYFTEESVRLVAPVLHGANIDLKSFRDETYRRVCGAKLKPVLDTIQLMKTLGIWIEITTLIIPGINDSESELKEIAQFIYSLDPGIPWHVTRFYPHYKMMDRPPTPIETMRHAREIGMEVGLKFVYTGNIPGEQGENTFCPHCKTLLIERWGFQIQKYQIKENTCANCGTRIEGMWTK